MTNNASTESSLIEWEWNQFLDNDFVCDFTTGADGSIYIAGSTDTDLDGETMSSYDGFITQFNPDGTENWTRLLGTWDAAYALTTGADGSIYIAGQTEVDLDGQINNGSYDAFISKFNPDGTKDWTRLLGTSARDHGRALTTGADGSIYIAGYTFGDLDGQTNSGMTASGSLNPDAFISKFNPDGTKDWTRLLGTSDWDEAHALTTGADGSIYIAGETEGNLDGQINSGYYDAFISKYNADGTKEWTRLLGTSENDFGRALTTGSDGSIYFAGSIYLSDGFISKFNADGTEDWSFALGTTRGEANALITGLDGSIYVAGNTEVELYSLDFDAFITQFNADGTDNWTEIFGSDYLDRANALTIGLDGSIYVSGDLGKDSGSWFSERDGAFISKLIEQNEFIATISGTSGTDNLESTTSNDSIDGGEGIDTIAYTGNFSSYSFTRATDTLEIADQRTTGTTDGTDTLKNIEYIQFADQLVETSKVDVVKTYSGDFSDYKFYNRGNGVYEIETDSGFDDITGYPLLTFTEEESTSSFKNISTIVDIKGTFDQVTGLDTDDAKMFRLYSAFKRLPDADGLKYWIGKYSSGENDERAVASSFLVSDEFKQRYGDDITDEELVRTMYVNVLGRDIDTDTGMPYNSDGIDLDESGFNYWVGSLNHVDPSKRETDYELLLGFSESTENKALFTEMTGFG